MKDDIAVGLFTEQRCRAHQGRSLLIAKTFIARARHLLRTWEDGDGGGDGDGDGDDNGDDDGVKSIDHFCGVPLPTCLHRKGDKNDSGENLPCTIRPGNGRNEASS